MAAERTGTSRTSDRGSEQGIAVALQRYRVMANVVGVLLIALVVVAVPLKYFADMPGPTRVLGITHGWLYFLFFLTAIDLALRAKWSPKGTVLVILAGTIPFVSFAAERTTTRKIRAGEPI
jgi:integral membrane protein